jgi:hypothetical protein
MGVGLQSSELVTAAAPCTSPRRRNRATGQKPFMVIACINLPRHAGRNDWYGLSLTFIAGQLLYLQADGVVSMSRGNFRGFGAHQGPLIIAFSILPCLSSSLLQKKWAERRGSSKNKTAISKCHEDVHLAIIQKAWPMQTAIQNPPRLAIHRNLWCTIPSYVLSLLMTCAYFSSAFPELQADLDTSF